MVKKPLQQLHTATVPITAPEGAAQAAGLRYVSDIQPGIRHQRAGRGFCYRGVDGAPIRDPEVLRRLKALAIPPAWTGVWICPRPDGHIQARGSDGADLAQATLYAASAPESESELSQC